MNLESHSECEIPSKRLTSLSLSRDSAKGKISRIMNSNKPEDIYARLRFFDNPPLPNKAELQKMYKDGGIPSEFLNVRKWPSFADEFNCNKKLLIYYGFRMPKTINGVISKLGGNVAVSISVDYLLSLFKDEPFIKK